MFVKVCSTYWVLCKWQDVSKPVILGQWFIILVKQFYGSVTSEKEKRKDQALSCGLASSCAITCLQCLFACGFYLAHSWKLSKNGWFFGISPFRWSMFIRQPFPLKKLSWQPAHSRSLQMILLLQMPEAYTTGQREGRAAMQVLLNAESAFSAHTRNMSVKWSNTTGDVSGTE